MPQARRQLDLAAASAALVADEPGGVTMASVARALRVAKPTLYRLARSRDELVGACVDAEAERLLERLHAAFGRSVGAPPRERLVAVFAAVLEYADVSPGGFELLFGGRYPQARPAVRRAEDRVRDLLEREARAAGRELDAAEPLAAALIGAAAGVAARPRDGDRWRTDELVRRLAAALER